MPKSTTLLIFVTLVLAACGGNSATVAIATPNSFTQAYKLIDPASVAGLTEIQTLASEHGDVVIKLAYRADVNQVLAVYDGGEVLGWDVDPPAIVIRHNIAVSSTNGLGFNRSGTLLMAAGEQFVANLHSHTINLITGISLWNMDTGQQTKCLSFTCDPNVKSILSTANPAWRLGSTLDPAGRWELDYSEDGIFILDMTGPTGGQVIQVNSPDANYWWHIGRIAFDEGHQRYAVIYQEGRIELSPLISTTIGPFAFGNKVVTSGRQNDLQPILDASFDPTGRWLAIIRNSELSLWQMEKEKQHPLAQDVQGPVALNFDQTGKLLFVGTPDQLKIWNVEKQAVIATLATPGISTLAISQDNRLLLWGDTHGVVHVWSAPVSP